MKNYPGNLRPTRIAEKAILTGLPKAIFPAGGGVGGGGGEGCSTKPRHPLRDIASHVRVKHTLTCTLYPFDAPS